MNSQRTIISRLGLAILALLMSAVVATAAVPGAPVDLRGDVYVQSNGDQDVYLYWIPDSSAGVATGSNIYQASGTGGGIAFTKIGTQADSANGYRQMFRVRNLAQGTYSFYVTSYNNDGESIPSNVLVLQIGPRPVIVRFTSQKHYADSMHVGQTLTYDFDATASDQSAVTFSVPRGVGSIDASTGVYTFTATKAGVFYAVVRVALASNPNHYAETDFNIYVLPGDNDRCVTIGGSVADDQGNAIASGWVFANPAGDSTGFRERAQVSNGSYMLRLVPGSYTLHFDGGNNGYPTQYNRGEVLDLPNCGDSAIADFVVGRRGRIDSLTGTVRRADNGATVTARVIFTNARTGEQVIEANTDSSGFYFVRLDANHTYIAHAIPYGQGDLTEQYYNGAPVEMTATPIVLSGGVITNIDFLLPVKGEGKIFGTIHGPRNMEVRGAVLAYQIASVNGQDVLGQVYGGRAAGGYFSVEGLPEGEYVLLGMSNDSNIANGYYKEGSNAVRTWMEATRVSIVGADSVHNVAIVLDLTTGGGGTARLRGTLSANAGRVAKGDDVDPLGMTAVSSAVVYLIDKSGSTAASTISDGNGAFEFNNIETGVYTLLADRVGLKPMRSTVTLTENQTSDRTFTMETGTSNVIVEQTPIAAPRLWPNPATSQLTITLPESMKSARIALFTSTGRQVWSGDVTSSTTTLEIAELPAGVYFARIIGNGASHGVPVNVVR